MLDPKRIEHEHEWIRDGDIFRCGVCSALGYKKYLNSGFSFASRVHPYRCRVRGCMEPVKILFVTNSGGFTGRREGRCDKHKDVK